jgi:hypothetical protein
MLVGPLGWEPAWLSPWEMLLIISTRSVIEEKKEPTEYEFDIYSLVNHESLFLRKRGRNALKITPLMRYGMVPLERIPSMIAVSVEEM